MHTPKLQEGEYRLRMIWRAREPIKGKEVVSLCQEPPATYTILKRLSQLKKERAIRGGGSHD